MTLRDEEMRHCQRCDSYRGYMCAEHREPSYEKLRERLAAAEAVLERCKIAVIGADSEMSAYGHGRPLDKESALRVSSMCRRSYDEIVAWLLGAAKAGGDDE